MNINHWNPKIIYPFKLKRLSQLLHEITEAEKITLDYDEQSLQSIWFKAIKEKLTNNKGFIKKSLRKTLSNLKVSSILFRLKWERWYMRWNKGKEILMRNFKKKRKWWWIFWKTLLEVRIRWQDKKMIKVRKLR